MIGDRPGDHVGGREKERSAQTVAMLPPRKLDILVGKRRRQPEGRQVRLAAGTFGFAREGFPARAAMARRAGACGFLPECPARYRAEPSCPGGPSIGRWIPAAEDRRRRLGREECRGWCRRQMRAPPMGRTKRSEMVAVGSGSGERSTSWWSMDTILEFTLCISAPSCTNWIRTARQRSSAARRSESCLPSPSGMASWRNSRGTSRPKHYLVNRLSRVPARHISIVWSSRSARPGNWQRSSCPRTWLLM